MSKTEIPALDDSQVIIGFYDALKKYSERYMNISYQGILFDLSRINDQRYFVKKAFQVISNQNTSEHSNAVQTRVLLIKWLEKFLNTQFQNTRDFRQKVGKYIQDYDARKLPVTERLKNAREKLSWTQTDLAKHLDYTSHVSIAQFEKGKRYPTEKVFKWLKEVEM